MSFILFIYSFIYSDKNIILLQELTCVRLVYSNSTLIHEFSMDNCTLLILMQVKEMELF